MMNTSDCRSLEVGEKVLEFENLDQILLVIDLISDLPLEVAHIYANRGDGLSHSCALNMSRKVDAILSIYLQKVALFEQEQRTSKLYLNKYAMAHSRRFDGGSIALLLAALSLALSTTGIVVSQTQINEINDRLHTMSVFIDSLQETQRQIATNIEYLYEASKFIGVEKDLLIEHINEMKAINSCNFMTANFEVALLRMEMRLNTLLKELVERKFSHDFIDLASLSIIVQHEYFRDTIYVVNPSALYNVGQIDFVSLKGSKVAALLSFPRILRSYKFKRVNIVESPTRLLFDDNHGQYYSFLLPIDIKLKDVAQNLSKLRSGQNCLNTNIFTACNVKSVLPYDSLLCLSNLLVGSENHCITKQTSVFDFYVSYTKKGALISMNSNAFVMDILRQRILHKSTIENHNCVYLSNRKNLIVQSDLRKLALFPMTLSFDVVPRKIGLEYRVIEIKNFTSPAFNHTKAYTPIVIPENPENEILEMVAIIMSTIVGVIILTFCMIKLGGCNCRRETVSANEIFPN